MRRAWLITDAPVTPALTALIFALPRLLILLLLVGACTLSACGNTSTNSADHPSPTNGVEATSRTHAPTPSPTALGPGIIAFARVSGDGTDIYTIRTDGTGLTRLTRTRDPEGMPSWSPDGGMIAYVRWMGGRGDGDATLWVMNADGSGQHRLTQANGYGPVWSPDGTRILFGEWEGNETWNLVVVETDGSGLSKLTANATIRGFEVWSPDGRIFYNEGMGTIYAMNANGSGLKEIAYAPGPFAISPDGKWLMIPDDTGAVVILVPASGQGPYRTLIKTSRYVSDGRIGLSWSPDGSAIVFAADYWSKRPSALYILKTDGSVRKVPNTGKVLDPVWGPR